MKMKNWVIHEVSFTGNEANVRQLMRKFNIMARQDYRCLKEEIGLVPKKGFNYNFMGVQRYSSNNGVAFIAETPLIDELKEIADYNKVNFELQYNSWVGFTFGCYYYYYESQQHHCLQFDNDADLFDIEFDYEKEVSVYEDIEYTHKKDLEKFIFDSAVRSRNIDMTLNKG